MDVLSCDLELYGRFLLEGHHIPEDVMAFLKKGPNRDQSPDEAAQLQQAHMANIKRMAENGDLVLAGPFGANELGMQGIYIFNV